VLRTTCSAPNYFLVLRLTMPRLLPEDILEDILVDGWLSRPFLDRWIFYCSVASLSHQWRGFIQQFVFRFVVLDYQTDWLAYRRLYLTLKDKPDPSVFSKCNIRMACSAPRSLNPTNPDFFQIPDCHSIELVDEAGSNWRPRIMLKDVLQYPSLTSVSMFFSNFHLPWAVPHSKEASGDDVIPSIQSLSLHGPEDAGPHITYVFPLMPNVSTLHLRSPTIRLASLANSIPNLRNLILDAGLTPNLSFVKPSNSYIMPYTIIAAIKGGLFSSNRDTPKNIIVNTSMEKPLGWKRIEEVCSGVGIKIQRVVVYDATSYPPQWGSGGTVSIYRFNQPS